MLQGTIQCPSPSTRKQTECYRMVLYGITCKYIEDSRKLQAAKEIIEAHAQLKKIGNDFL